MILCRNSPPYPEKPAVAGPTDVTLLQILTNFAVRKGEADGFALLALLKLLLRHLSPASRGDINPDLAIIMIKLATVGKGVGHKILFQATLDWIFKYQHILPTESWAALSQEDLTSPPPELAAFCCLLQYTTDVLYSLNFLSSNENKTSAEASSTNSLLMMERVPCPRCPVSVESQQPLCYWTEVPGHRGHLLTLTQSSYTPVVIMVEEIKVVPFKVKLTDMVALRH